MNIDETATYVNKRLREGYSTAKTERELNYGKDTLRKKLNRANYFFHKDKNEFILDNTNTTHTEEIIKDKPITQTHNTNITHDNPSNNNKDTITQPEDEVITQNDNTKITQPRAFTDEDFNILFQIIDEFKYKTQIVDKPMEIPTDNSDLTTRSFRSYKSVFESFSSFCKENKLQQKDAVAEALLTFISK